MTRFAYTLAAVLAAMPALGAEIKGPKELAPYKMAEHSLDTQAMWEVVPIDRTAPADTVDLKQSADGKSVTWVAPPGKYQVTAFVVVIDFEKKTWTMQRPATVVTITGTVNPPQPPDPVNPPSPGGKKQVFFFYDRSRLDNLTKDQQEMISGEKFRADLCSRGHRFVGARDPTVTGPGGVVPAAYVPWFQAVLNDPMPRIAISPIGGGDIVDYDLPAMKADAWKLIEGGAK